MQKYGLSVASVAAALLLTCAPALAADYGTTGDDAGPGPAAAGMKNTDAGDMPANPTDEAPAMVIPGSATPGGEIKSGEIEVTGKPRSETEAIDTTKDTDELEATGTDGGTRDATGGYDASGTIQMDEGDAEANAALTNDGVDSALRERNLREAMDPKNASFKSRSRDSDTDM